MGALTKGDRRAADASDMSAFDLDNVYGRQALKNMIQSIHVASEIVAMKRNRYSASGNSGVTDKEERQQAAGIALNAVGIVCSPDEMNGTGTSVPKFLNRLLGLEVGLQKEIFKTFMNEANRLIDDARREGRYDEGVVELRGKISEAKDSELLHSNEETNVSLTLHNLSIDQGMSWGEAHELGTECPTCMDEFSVGDLVTVVPLHSGVDDVGAVSRVGKDFLQLVYRDDSEHDVLRSRVRKIPLIRFFRSKKTFVVGTERRHVVMMAKQRLSNEPSMWVDPLYQLYRPHTGPNTLAKRLAAIRHAYVEIDVMEAETMWKIQAEASVNHCVHGIGCKKGGYPNCTTGARTREVAILSGCILRVWSIIAPEVGFTSTSLGNDAKGARKLPLTRVQLVSGKRLVGVMLEGETKLKVINAIRQMEENEKMMHQANVDGSAPSAVMGGPIVPGVITEGSLQMLRQQMAARQNVMSIPGMRQGTAQTNLKRDRFGVPIPASDGLFDGSTEAGGGSEWNMELSTFFDFQ